ncbi:MAG: bifunctional riboflavin kinase/FAD synthetase [Terriglobia bacterium]
MRVLRSASELPRPLPTPIVTVGNFDGVHRGHQRILEKVREHARARQGTAVALTFDPHPARVLTPDRTPPLLTTAEQKLKLLEAEGIQVALVLPFTEMLAQVPPRLFIKEIVCGQVGARVLCAGYSFRFGHNQAGTVELLRLLAEELDFQLEVIPPVVLAGDTATSTLIRRLVSEGEIARAARLLGRPFALTGPVQPGAGRGAPLGFPTLNMVPEQECLPARGVYVTETLVEGRAYPSATNVGVRPTFDGDRLVIESHLLDFSAKVEGGRLELRFRERLRGEQKFPSPEALRAQIAKDIEHARRFFDEKGKTRDRPPPRVTATN